MHDLSSAADAAPYAPRRGRSDGVVSRHFDDLDSVLEFAALFSFQKNG
jgi:hypothetical protein